MTSNGPHLVAVMHRQFKVGNFGVGVGWNRPSWEMDAPLVDVTFSDMALGVQEIDSRGRPEPDTTPFFPNHWSWRYAEIKVAQVVEIRGLTALFGPSPRQFPLGVRLDMGSWRTAPILVTDQLEELLDQLATQRVPVEREPRRLNRLLFGRR